MDPIELTRRLAAADSPSGAEEPAVAVMEEILREAGWPVQRQTVTPGRDNLYAFREPPRLVFSTHLDTVPPYVPLREDDQWLYGRGVCDAKGIAAAMLCAAEELAQRGERRIGLLFLVGEETGSDGARAALALTPKGDVIINGEPTESRLVTGSKGALHVRLAATGRAAHSAYPDEGRSAILALLDSLNRIRELPLPVDPILGPATLNIGMIDGGVAENVIPPMAQARLFYRTVGDTQALRQAVRAALAPEVEAEFGVEIPPYTGHGVAGWESTVVSYTSDLPTLSPTWGRGYMLGPGSIRVAHTADERISKAELVEAVTRYVRLAGELLVGETD
ncbi:MAG TPA: M20/M25/M40 family metallo-hydrolase [Gemmatimonadales bacterium]|nr:M20/M25/M40 family metallo-hydrolase [Gemmatimonadales bacterium]